jgi:FAD/FMN-containing dehydrogenase/Fe-S oxidoreductase
MPPPPAARTTDLLSSVDELAFALRRELDGEVRFDPGSRHLYATDASNYRQLPIGVVVPRSVDDIVRTHELCRVHGVPITNRGGGTSLAGQACNAAVIIDSSKYLTTIGDIDPDARTVTVEPGVVLDDLKAATARHGLEWGPDPSTHNRCTIGGMLGNDSCGMHAFRYGRAQDNVRELDVLLHDGTRLQLGQRTEEDLDRVIRAGGREGDIHARLRDIRDRYGDRIRDRFPDIPRRVSGYNLDALLPELGFDLARALVGTEGTCATILGATLDLNPHLPERVLVVLGYPSIYDAADHVPEIRRSRALACEGIDRHLVDNIRDLGIAPHAVEALPDGNGWLIVEFGGDTPDEAEEHARDFLRSVGERADAPVAELHVDRAAQATIWEAREAGLGATAHFGNVDHWPGWEDSAVPPERMGDYLRDLRGLFDRYGYDAAMYGHFGDGCLHCRIDFDLASADGIARYRRFLEDAADLVSSYGGSYSGEHGDGQQRGELLERMYGADLVRAFGEFKAAFDPDGLMNPGKVIDPRPMDADLRLGHDYRPWHPETVFAYPEDHHDFARAQMRCVGIGLCRRDDDAGTMCPSYMVTHEEQHSTRGRARLLFEMLQPDSELDGWQDEHVHEALDLCLSCKACAGDCPVNVDMATYKAEFLHHHYDGRRRPPVHYALGLIDVWSRLASRVPRLANAALAAPGLASLAKRVAGVEVRRPAPRYATTGFREWFSRRPSAAEGAPRVLLFPDTFVEHFTPEVGRATVEVLEDAGYQVVLPPEQRCCGRPLYDHGMLEHAQRYLDRMVAMLRDEVSSGTRIVGMEPSCVTVFRDELTQLRPQDEDAQRISRNTFTLAEFLVEVGYEPPRLGRRATVHGHCHHKSVIGMDADSTILDAMGLDWQELDAGCCGLAGSFGFEAGEKYEVSVAAGERKLMPAVRRAPLAELLIADGFSCRTQIEHLQDGDVGREPRTALHLAQVIQLARQHGPDGPPPGDEPVEQALIAADPSAVRPAVTVVVVLAAAVSAGAWWVQRRGVLRLPARIRRGTR